jgi:uncharacterized membrane protein YccC
MMMVMSGTLPHIGLAQLDHAARILAACALSYAITWLCNLPEGYWSLITVIVVTHPDLPATLTASRDRLVGTLIGAAVGAVAIVGRVHGVPTLPLYAAGLLPLALVTAVWPNLRLTCVTLTVVLLPPPQGADFSRPAYRVLENLLGTVIAAGVSLPALLRRGQSTPTG